ncbi:MAG: GlsB/YeaQ/YmgE family stress response membrane protein [Chloroflexi bacterium]|uniref:GlsB/YeaQ/YmgE family stress response membrane protein n=1 Tax=Candidatus Chlorohelix allophototropha TaxID=3003348 RepID=A0A8T7M8N3_9CHLR|nr:GlsB/YeaQ/YmgE family stress response membrane protein [Chloroflexota bacterium]WJW68348.1 GlsB/YeaQ/YmgE family stress response membrane protein [Chloroflexota bacterium L227-S17]
MSIIAWLVVGLVAGWIANMIMSSGRGGLITDLVIGILGAIVGGFLLGLVTKTDYTTGINVPTILVAIGGAIVLLALYRLATGRRILRNGRY